MTKQNPDRLPDELRDIDARLQARRPEVSALELDELKLRTTARAFRPKNPTYGRQQLMRSKLVSMMLVLGLAVSAGTAGVIAGNGNGNGKGKSADSSRLVRRTLVRVVWERAGRPALFFYSGAGTSRQQPVALAVSPA
jgi:hypothetical protein